MNALLLRASGIWLVIVVAAVANGLFREAVLVPLTGAAAALPLSGILLSILVVLVAFATVAFLGAPAPRTLWLVGLFWVALTLAFEFLFGHFVAGKPWREILQVFDVGSGNLFLLVLVVTALAPRLAGRLRGIV